MQSEAALKLLCRAWPLRELGEHLHLDGAQQGLGGPEAEAYLQDVLGAYGACDRRVCHCSDLQSLTSVFMTASSVGHRPAECQAGWGASSGISPRGKRLIR